MGIHVCTGAMMMCSFGAAPSTFSATPKMIKTANMDAGNIMDNKPVANIPPFGVCMSMANPQVAAATAAALGVLTPMPCMPVIAAPWAPGSPTVMVSNQPGLNESSKLMCNWAGVISITYPGQVTEMIP
jgi:hypothetical protein